MTRSVCSCVALMTIGCLAMPLHAEDEAKPADVKPAQLSDSSTSSKATEVKPAENAKPAPAVFTVKQGPFKVELSLEGVLESTRNSEVSIHPKTWTDWAVETAVPQGTQIKQGELLVQFDTTKIDEQIRDLEAGRKLVDLSLEQVSNEIGMLEQAMPLDLQAAERTNRLAETDLQQFLSQDREYMQRQVNFMVKMYDNYLAYQKEELKQLEKMYKADDLTEETEEIVLKRTRDSVEMYEFQVEMAKFYRDRLLKIQLPRQEEQLKDHVRRAALALQRARITLPVALDKLRLELEKQRTERTKTTDRLAQLQHDRGLMKVTAPCDGLVYYGPCIRGQWQGAQVAAKLRPGGRVSPDEVIVTLVDPTKLFVRATIPEKDLWQVRRGLTGIVLPVGYGEQRLAASIDELKSVPTPEGKYLATVLVDSTQIPKDLPSLAPGMTCKVKLTSYTNDGALTLPAGAVHVDPQRDDQNYVWLNGDDGKPTRHDVTVGRRTDSTVEITGGMKAGEKVLKEAPKEDA